MEDVYIWTRVGNIEPWRLSDIGIGAVILVTNEVLKQIEAEIGIASGQDLWSNTLIGCDLIIGNLHSVQLKDNMTYITVSRVFESGKGTKQQYFILRSPKKDTELLLGCYKVGYLEFSKLLDSSCKGTLVYSQ